MLRCNRCGRYYIPGFLDCQCRTTSNTGLAYSSPSANRAMTTLPLGAAGATVGEYASPRVRESVGTSELPVPKSAGSGSNLPRTPPQHEKG